MQKKRCAKYATKLKTDNNNAKPSFLQNNIVIRKIRK